MWQVFYFLSFCTMAKYTISHQLRLDVRNYEDFWLNWPEQMEGYLYKTDDISLLEYANLSAYLNQYFAWYTKKTKVELSFVVNEKTYKANTYLSYGILQIDKYWNKHDVGFGEIIITDNPLPDFEYYE